MLQITGIINAPLERLLASRCALFCLRLYCFPFKGSNPQNHSKGRE